ncbi:hypothetical protein ACJX0J_008589 [Zea mays]
MHIESSVIRPITSQLKCERHVAVTESAYFFRAYKCDMNCAKEKERVFFYRTILQWKKIRATHLETYFTEIQCLFALLPLKEFVQEILNLTNHGHFLIFLLYNWDKKLFLKIHTKSEILVLCYFHMIFFSKMTLHLNFWLQKQAMVYFAHTSEICDFYMNLLKLSLNSIF